MVEEFPAARARDVPAAMMPRLAVSVTIVWLTGNAHKI